MDLGPPALREKAAAKYADEVKRFNWHLATGFIGTPRLLPGLHAAGRDDVAYKLLLQETYPSWLFQVKLGATTMWERWDGWTPDHGFQTIGMNSFNHYAFGSVGEYLYSVVGGIRAASPGFDTIRIQPVPGEGLNWAEASYRSIHGPIETRWQRSPRGLELTVVIPPNTTAFIYVPATDPAKITESGKPASEAEGVKFLRMEKGAAVYEIGSGKYAFRVAK
jgi:alpha-L-rhamnosidase